MASPFSSVRWRRWKTSLGRRWRCTASEKTLAPNGLLAGWERSTVPSAPAVGAPLGRGDVLLTDGCHVAGRSSYGRALRTRFDRITAGGQPKRRPVTGLYPRVQDSAAAFLPLVGIGHNLSVGAGPHASHAAPGPRTPVFLYSGRSRRSGRCRWTPTCRASPSCAGTSARPPRRRSSRSRPASSASPRASSSPARRATRAGAGGRCSWAWPRSRVASLPCAAAPDVWSLIAARLLQGVAGAAGIVLARAVARDLHAGRRARPLLRAADAGERARADPRPGGRRAAAARDRLARVFVFLAALGPCCWPWPRRCVPETLPPERRHGGGLADTRASFGVLLAIAASWAAWSPAVSCSRPCSPTSPGRRSCSRTSTASRTGVQPGVRRQRRRHHGHERR